jgi:hypothetical protein
MCGLTLCRHGVFVCICIGGGKSFKGARWNSLWATQGGIGRKHVYRWDIFFILLKKIKIPHIFCFTNHKFNEVHHYFIMKVQEVLHGRFFFGILYHVFTLAIMKLEACNLGPISLGFGLIKFWVAYNLMMTLCLSLVWRMMNPLLGM